MAKSSSIALLQPPPAWALASSIASDRVLRQKWIRDEFGSTSTTTSKLNRHQRKNRLKQLRNSNSVDGNRAVCGGNSSIPDSYSSLLRSSVGGSLMTIINRARLHLIPNKNNHSSPNIRAIIASGSGPDGLAAARKSRKRRRFMVQSTAVIVLSMILMIVMQKWNNIKSVVREKGQADTVEGRHYPQMKGHVEDEIWRNAFEDQGGNDPSSESSSCSSSSDNYSATYDNNSGSNDSKDGAEDRNNEDMKASVDCEYDDLIPNSSSDEHENEMATKGNDCGISGSGRRENVSCNFLTNMLTFLLQRIMSYQRHWPWLSLFMSQQPVGFATTDLVVVPKAKKEGIKPRNVERSIMKFAGRCLDHTKNLNVLPRLVPNIAKNSVQLVGNVHHTLDKQLRRMFKDSAHNAVTVRRIQSDSSSSSQQRRTTRLFLARHAPQFPPASQVSINLLSSLSKALRLGLKNIEVHWNMIAIEAKEEFALEIEGGPRSLWADDVTQAWRRREASLIHHGRTIAHSVVNAIEETKIGLGTRRPKSASSGSTVRVKVKGNGRAGVEEGAHD
jgi:hypothetical protein